MQTVILNIRHKILEIKIQTNLFLKNLQIVRYKRKYYISKLLDNFKNKYQNNKNSIRFKVALSVLYTLPKDKTNN